MHPVLMVTVALLVPSIIVGGVVAFQAIRDARDGYEDEHGFWYGPNTEPRPVRVQPDAPYVPIEVSRDVT